MRLSDQDEIVDLFKFSLITSNKEMARDIICYLEELSENCYKISGLWPH